MHFSFCPVTLKNMRPGMDLQLCWRRGHLKGSCGKATTSSIGSANFEGTVELDCEMKKISQRQDLWQSKVLHLELLDCRKKGLFSKPKRVAKGAVQLAYFTRANNRVVLVEFVRMVQKSPVFLDGLVPTLSANITAQFM